MVVVMMMLALLGTGAGLVLRHEDVLAVVLQLLEAFLDVVQSAVGIGLRRGLGEGLGVPPSAQLLHRAHVLFVADQVRPRMKLAERTHDAHDTTRHTTRCGRGISGGDAP